MDQKKSIDFETAMQAQKCFERRYRTPLRVTMLGGLTFGTLGVVVSCNPNILPYGLFPSFAPVLMIGGALCLLYVFAVHLKIAAYGIPNCPEMDEYCASMQKTDLLNNSELNPYICPYCGKRFGMHCGPANPEDYGLHSFVNWSIVEGTCPKCDSLVTQTNRLIKDVIDNDWSEESLKRLKHHINNISND